MIQDTGSLLKMERIVMKFGGTSLGTSENIKNVAKIVADSKSYNPIVVVSAVSGMTDQLIDSAKDIFYDKKSPDEVFAGIISRNNDIVSGLPIDKGIVDKTLEKLKARLYNLDDLSARTMDEIMSFGERISSKILAAVLSNMGVVSKAYNAYDIGMITTDMNGNAEPLGSSYEKIAESLSKIKDVPIITGFIGKDAREYITTLGRGGSDFTAAIIAGAVKADEIQIWTDVNGVMTTDPRIVPDAKTIEIMTFKEAAELAFFGAKVLHPRTMIPAISAGIPIIVKNTMDPDKPGTKIVKDLENCYSLVTAISLKKNIDIIRVESTRMLNAHGFLAKIFDIFEKHQLSIDMISTSEVSVSMTISDKQDYKEAVEELSEFGKINIYKNNCIVCVVGRCLHKYKTIHGQIFSCLEDNDINIKMISQGPSLINVGFAVDSDDGEKSIRLLHDYYFKKV